jgi:hypothetical protein
MTSSSPLVLEMNQWEPSKMRYMQPKVNDRGLKSITTISTQTNRALYLTLPPLLCWGISDFVDEKTGESDGKYTISLQFPKESSTASDEALQKLKTFENLLIEDAVKNSEAWFGRKQTREITEFSYFPFLKYSKNKDTKLVDYSKPPSLRPKVPCYDGVWKTEIYDVKGAMLFPSDQEGITPIDFVPKSSTVMSVIQCGGIWVGGKGWGLTWKLIQCVVKPQVMSTPFGKCHIKLSASDIETIQNAPVQQEEEPAPSYVENSDDEGEKEETKEKVETKEVKEEPVKEEEVKEPEPVVVKKKILKKVTK